jgi:hypothetical protein
MAAAGQIRPAVVTWVRQLRSAAVILATRLAYLIERHQSATDSTANMMTIDHRFRATNRVAVAHPSATSAMSADRHRPSAVKPLAATIGAGP